MHTLQSFLLGFSFFFQTCHLVLRKFFLLLFLYFLCFLPFSFFSFFFTFLTFLLFYFFTFCFFSYSLPSSPSLLLFLPFFTSFFTKPFLRLVLHLLFPPYSLRFTRYPLLLPLPLLLSNLLSSDYFRLIWFIFTSFNLVTLFHCISYQVSKW